MIVAEDAVTNIQLLAGTPPAFPVLDQPAEQVLNQYWYAGRISRPLEDDSCSGLEAKAGEINNFLQFNIRTLEDDADVEKLDSKKQAGIQQDIPSRIASFPTGTFIKPTGALMSTPYHGTDRRFVRNLVKDSPLNINEEENIYFWEIDEADYKYVRPRNDGSITVTPRGRRDNNFRRLTLPVVDNEPNFT
jgi:hypothetical protein